MRPVRVAVVHLLLAVIVAGGLWDTLTFAEHWPFSRYSMFARVVSGPWRERLVLYGVRGDGGEDSLTSPAYLYPLDAYKLDVSLSNLAGVDAAARDRSTPAAPERVEPALADILRRYELRRSKRQHAGPELVGLRLYRVRASRALPDSAPLERRLLAEVRR
jgi:hypothetical protein